MKENERKRNYVNFVAPLMTLGVAVLITYGVVTVAPFDIVIQSIFFAVFLAIAFIFYWMGFQILIAAFKFSKMPTISPVYRMNHEELELTSGSIKTVIKFSAISELEKPTASSVLIHAYLKDGQRYDLPLPDSRHDFYNYINERVKHNF